MENEERALRRPHPSSRGGREASESAPPPSHGGRAGLGRQLKRGRVERRTAGRWLKARSGELCLLAAAATAEAAAAQLRRLRRLVPAVADALAKLRTPSSCLVCSNASALPIIFSCSQSRFIWCCLKRILQSPKCSCFCVLLTESSQIDCLRFLLLLVTCSFLCIKLYVCTHIFVTFSITG